MNKIDYGFYEVHLFEGEMNSDWSSGKDLKSVSKN